MSVSTKEIGGYTLRMNNYGSAVAKIEVLHKDKCLYTLVSKPMQEAKLSEQEIRGFLAVISKFDCRTI